MSTVVLERIHQVFRNLLRNFNISQTYVDENDLWTRILAATSFAISSTTNRVKGYSTDQLVLVRYIILPIKHEVDWELLRQKNQAQIKKDNIRKKKHRVEHDYKVGDNIMLTKHTRYKYETPYTGPFLITQCFNNGTVNLHCGTTKIR